MFQRNITNYYLIYDIIYFLKPILSTFIITVKQNISSELSWLASHTCIRDERFFLLNVHVKRDQVFATVSCAACDLNTHRKML